MNFTQISKVLQSKLVTACSGVRMSNYSFSLYAFESLSSTMDISSRWAAKEIDEQTLSCNLVVQTKNDMTPLHFVTFLALSQSHGRGRKDQRVWHSPPGHGIYVTFFVELSCSPEQLAGLSLVMGLAVQDCTDLLGIQTWLKWPNDVLASAKGDPSRRKLSGMLVDVGASRTNPASRNVHIGIGLNVGRQNFPEGVPGISLEETYGKAVDYASIFAALCSSVCGHLTIFSEQGFLPFARIWNERSGMLGEHVQVELEGRKCSGFVRGINETGALLLEEIETQQIITVHSGEVAHVPTS